MDWWLATKQSTLEMDHMLSSEAQPWAEVDGGLRLTIDAWNYSQSALILDTNVHKVDL